MADMQNQQIPIPQTEMSSDPNPVQIQVVSEPKKSKWWIWFMIVLAVIIVAGGIYYFFFMK